MGRIADSAAVTATEAFARTRLGLFTTADAVASGVSTPLLRYHSRVGGRWSHDLPGVYRLVAVPSNWRGRFLAALLWAGDQSVLSHRAAAAILGLDGVRPGRAELWARKTTIPDGLIVHRGVVDTSEIATTGLLRHTNLIRTVVDLAAVLDDDALELAVESAIRQRRASEDALGAAAHRPRGPKSLRRVLARRPAGAPATESELETRYLQVIRVADVPPPVRQFEIQLGRCVRRLDVCWPEVGLWVELDGRAWHDSPAALLSDRHRQNELVTLLQWLPLRFTWDDVTRRPLTTARSTEASYKRRAVGGYRGSARSTFQ